MAVTWADAPAPRAGEITKGLADELVVDRLGSCIPIIGEAPISGGDISGIVGTELDLRASITNVNIVAGRAYVAVGQIQINGSVAGNGFVVRIREGAAPSGGNASTGAIVVDQVKWVAAGGGDDAWGFLLRWVAAASDNDGDFHLSAIRVSGAGTLNVYDAAQPAGSAWMIGEIG